MKVQNKEVNITFEDQKRINLFSKMNRRKMANMGKLRVLVENKKLLQDCLEELEMSMEDTVNYQFSECYLEVPLEEAVGEVEGKLGKLNKEIELLKNLKKSQNKELDSLKKELYVKFGDSIQLEE